MRTFALHRITAVAVLDGDAAEQTAAPDARSAGHEPTDRAP